MNHIHNSPTGNASTTSLLLLVHALFLATIIWICLPGQMLSTYFGSGWLWLLAMPLASLAVIFRLDLSAAWRALLVRAPRRRQSRISRQAVAIKFRRSRRTAMRQVA